MLPITFLHIDPIRIDKRVKDLFRVDWLMREVPVKETGLILRLVFRYTQSMLTFNYDEAKAAFLDPQVASLFGQQGCGLHPNGAEAPLPHYGLIDYLLPKSPLTINEVAHVVAHAFHPLIQEIFLPGDRGSQLVIVDRVGLNRDPNHPSTFVVGYYVEPGSVEQVGAGRTVTLRAEALLDFLDKLFAGEVDVAGLQEAYAKIREAEKSVRRETPPFSGPEGQDAPRRHPQGSKLLLLAS